MARTPKSISPQKLARHKTLNLIYFIDSNSTRSIRMSLGKVWVVGALLLAILCWACGSVWLLYSSQKQHQREQERIRELQAGIFKYQNQSDAVYEAAYPNGQKISKPNDNIQNIAEDKAQEDSPTPVAEVSVVEKHDEVTEEGADDDSQPVAVDVSKISSKGSSSLVMKYVIKNDANSAKVEGRVWSIARYVGIDGQHYFVPYPSGVGASSDGTPRNPEKGTRFFIRRFRSVESKFDAPSNIQGSFDKVTVYARTKKGVLSTRDVPIEIDVGYKKPETAPTIKNEESINKSNKTISVPIHRKGMSAQNSIEPNKTQNQKSGSSGELDGH